MVTEKDALCLIALAEDHGIAVFLDGGWGVDALLGRQTRVHDDIDLFMVAEQGVRYIALLQEHGFREVIREFTTASHRAWADDRGRVVDLHLFGYGADGAILFEGGVYPAGVFGGTGRIAGHRVCCIPPAEQVEFHRGYDFDENDVHDVRLLCERFGIPLPKEYQ